MCVGVGVCVLIVCAGVSLYVCAGVSLYVCAGVSLYVCRCVTICVQVCHYMCVYLAHRVHAHRILISIKDTPSHMFTRIMVIPTSVYFDLCSLEQKMITP